MASPSLLIGVPVRVPSISPKHETAEKGAIAAGDVPPGLFSPTENAYIAEAHDVLTEDVQYAEGEKGMLSVVVAVVEAMCDEGEHPQKEIHDGIDEEESELSLNRSATTLQGSSGDVFSRGMGGMCSGFMLGDGSEAWRRSLVRGLLATRLSRCHGRDGASRSSEFHRHGAKVFCADTVARCNLTTSAT